MEDIINGCDRGIRELVCKLRVAGFNTTDSGDGVSKGDLIASGDALDIAHVMIVVEDCDHLVREANRLRVFMMTHPDEWDIQATYDPEDMSSIIMLMGRREAS